MKKFPAMASYILYTKGTSRCEENGCYWDRTSGLFDRVGSQRVTLTSTFPATSLRTGRTPFSVSGSPKVPTRKPQ